MDLMRLAREERADLAEFLATLSPEQWSTPSLCAGWTVRDVVAHVISFEELDARGLIRRFAKGFLLPDRINAVGVAASSARNPVELIALLNEHLEPRGLMAAFGGLAGLVDGLIHHQDIRRPLEMKRDIPAERLLPALSFAMKTPLIRGFWHARGLRMIATDLDWSTGKGPEVSGTAEAILMAIAGRPAAVADLDGAGQQKLAHRLGG